MLNEEQRKNASYIYTSLKKIKTLFGKLDCTQIKSIIKDDIKKVNGIHLDYLEIVDPHSFKPLKGQNNKENAIALIAVYLGDIRLIDNLSLND